MQLPLAPLGEQLPTDRLFLEPPGVEHSSTACDSTPDTSWRRTGVIFHALLGDLEWLRGPHRRWWAFPFHVLSQTACKTSCNNITLVADSEP